MPQLEAITNLYLHHKGKARPRHELWNRKWNISRMSRNTNQHNFVDLQLYLLFWSFAAHNDPLHPYWSTGCYRTRFYLFISFKPKLTHTSLNSILSSVFFFFLKAFVCGLSGEARNYVVITLGIGAQNTLHVGEAGTIVNLRRSK